MIRGFSPATKLRIFTGELKEAKDVKVGDQLMGDDGNPRPVSAASTAQGQLYKVSYSTYLDSKFDHSFVCAAGTSIVVIPDGNREQNRFICTNAEGKYQVEFIEPIVDASNAITKIELRRRVFEHAEDALTFVDKGLPNFLYETTVSEFLAYGEEVRRMFKLVRPLLPIRYVAAVTAIQDSTKELVDSMKEFGVRSTDMPWLCGLYLVAGTSSGDPSAVRFFLKELHVNVSKEIRRIFDGLRAFYQLSYSDEKGSLDVRFIGKSENQDFFRAFMKAMGMYDPAGKKYNKEGLKPGVYLESFSRIRGPFLAGILDGSSDYGLSDINHGLECYVRGLTTASLKEVVAELARSCSLTAVPTADPTVVTLAGGMLFRIPCVSTIPKDFPGLVSLTSYPNIDGTSVLLGMPMPFQITEEGQGPAVSITLDSQLKRCLLADYTVVNV